MTDVVAIAFTPASPKDSPNAKAASADHALTTFHNLIELTFASVRRWNPWVDLVLVTTSDPGPALRTRFTALDVEILETTFAHRPPDGFYPSFNASLFSLDAMAALADRYRGDDRIVLTDPDVVCTRSLETLFESVDAGGFLVYDTQYGPDHVNQGLTATQAGLLHQQLDPSLRGIPRHYGGELYGFTAQSWRAVAPHVEAAWAFSLDQWESGLPKFVTEEHLLNYALRHTRVGQASPFIRRIWTAPTHRTVQPGDVDLALWHLPAEKHRGLARLHRVMRQPDSWFWTGSAQQWQKLAARDCGVHRRSFLRWGRDHAARSVRRLQQMPQRVRRVTA